MLQKDGTVVCTHELLSPIGLFHSRLIKVKEPSTVLQKRRVLAHLATADQDLKHNSTNVYFPLSYPFHFPQYIVQSDTITMVVMKGITANICWLCKFDWSDTGIYSHCKVVLIIAIYVCTMPESATILGLYSASLIPSLIPSQHENEAGLIPRPYSLQQVRLEWDQTGLATESIASFPGSPRMQICIAGRAWYLFYVSMM